MSQKKFTDEFIRNFAEMRNKRSPGVIRQAIDEALVRTDCVIVSRALADVHPDVAMREAAARAQATELVEFDHLRIAAEYALSDLKWAEKYANADFRSSIARLESALGIKT